MGIGFLIGNATGDWGSAFGWGIGGLIGGFILGVISDPIIDAYYQSKNEQAKKYNQEHAFEIAKKHFSDIGWYRRHFYIRKYIGLGGPNNYIDHPACSEAKNNTKYLNGYHSESEKEDLAIYLLRGNDGFIDDYLIEYEKNNHVILTEEEKEKLKSIISVKNQDKYKRLISEIEQNKELAQEGIKQNKELAQEEIKQNKKLTQEELEHEANSINDEKALTEEKVNPVRSEYEELKKTPEFRKWRAKQYTIQKGHCAYCYRVYPSSKMQVDHITPICHGGTNDYSNFVLACRYCNEKVKYTSAFNRVSFFRAKKRIRDNYDLRSKGYVPIKIYWRRPKWIPPNPISDDKVEYDDSIPESERNVWNFVNPIAPISIASSIKQEDVEDHSGFIAQQQETYENSGKQTTKDTLWDFVGIVLNFIFENFGKIIIGLIIICVLWFSIYYSNWQKEREGKAPSSVKSDTTADCGCGEELLCYDGECHCVFEYDPACEESESWEDVYYY